MKTKKDAEKSLKALEQWTEYVKGKEEVIEFIEGVKEQLPDAESTPEERRQAVRDAAKKGFHEEG